ncbi:MAG: alpha/beta fold hydrolase [Erysipelotrichaceae bacterium]|nr:alpha/beta fold hydrolase [Erysipelotrichaceae bacterium]
MKKVKALKRQTIKVFILGSLGFLSIFSIVSMIAVVFIYNGQFPRYDRYDTTITASLRYDDIQADYPRNLKSFMSGENVLQGYVYGEDHNQGLVVVVHGIGGGADSYLPQIKYFVDKGWRVFAYDATGSFDSEGKTTKGFPQALLDLDAAITFINSQSEFTDLPVLLFGHSWGGYAVANLMHFDHDVKAVVSVSGANSPMEVIMEQGHSMMGDFITVQYPFLWMYQYMLFNEAASLNAVDAINDSDVPMLIVHGTDDQTIQYNGCSIISKKNDIHRLNVEYISRSSLGQNGHNDLFYSDASREYIDKVNIEYRQLYNQYDQKIPYDIKQAFYSKLDRVLFQDLDSELMDRIDEFFLKSLGK